MSRLTLATHFIRRELRERYRGSFTGFGWALLQPLLQLAIYAFVFVQIFKARVPGAGAPGYVAFLVVAMWPWVAFSDAVVRSTTALQDNAALIGKVALPREILVLAPCSASFLLHACGYVAILVVLALAGQDVHIARLPLALLMYVPMFAYTFGVALIFASLQVFVRDLVQMLGQLLTLMMFAAPDLLRSGQSSGTVSRLSRLQSIHVLCRVAAQHPARLWRFSVARCSAWPC